MLDKSGSRGGYPSLPSGDDGMGCDSLFRQVDAKQGKRSLNGNPYSTPNGGPGQSNDSASGGLSLPLSSESRVDLRFCANIATFLSVFCVAAAVYSSYATIRDLRDLTREFGGWTWLHYLTVVRALFIPVLLAFSCFTWRCASSLRTVSSIRQLPNDHEMDTHIRRFTWLWIGTLLSRLSRFLKSPRDTG